MNYLTRRESAAANEVFTQYPFTPAELATAIARLPAAIEARMAVKRASHVKFQGGDAYHAAHTVAARITRERCAE